MLENFKRHIDEHHCKGADQFLQHLRPRLDPGSVGDFIYRGVGDAEKHRLIPSALRTEPPMPRSMTSTKAQLLELVQLSQFVAACDRSGLRVPGDCSELRETLEPLYWEEGRWPATWPPPEHWQLWAVAQHHGVPTRLLDWSRVSTIAAYFAACSCLQLPPGGRSERLAVWALDVRGEGVWGDELAIVRIPAAHSPNLAAQHGVFTVTLASGSTDSLSPMPPPRSVEDIIRACTFEKGLPKPVRGPFVYPRPEVLLVKYTLGRKHATDLLDLCRAYGVSGATMFPGFDGAAREVNEKRLCWTAYPESPADKRRRARVQASQAAFWRFDGGSEDSGE